MAYHPKSGTGEAGVNPPVGGSNVRPPTEPQYPYQVPQNGEGQVMGYNPQTGGTAIDITVPSLPNGVRPLQLSDLPCCPPPVQSQELKLAFETIEAQKKLIIFLEKELQFLMDENVRVETQLQEAQKRLEKAG